MSDRQLVSFKATMGNAVRFRLSSLSTSRGFTSLLCVVVLLLLFVAHTHTLDCTCLALCVLLIQVSSAVPKSLQPLSWQIEATQNEGRTELDVSLRFCVFNGVFNFGWRRGCKEG